MQRVSRRAAIAGVLTLLFAALLLPGAARAGTYTISGAGCGFWQPYNSNDGYLAVYPSCGAVVVRNVGGPGLAPAGVEGDYIFNAPAGTVITGYTVSGTMVGTNGWQASLHGSYGPDAEGCPGSGCPGGSKLVGGVWYQGYSSPAVAMRLRCGSTSGCSRAAQYGWAEVDAFAAILYDGSPPGVAINGGDVLSGWRRGTSTVTYDANDNSGIKTVRAYVDGQPRAEAPRGCNYHALVPCPNGGGSLSVDTTGMSDGAHQITVQAVDTADNVANDARTIYTDNTPPSSPASLMLHGPDGWRTSNSFDVSWNNPPQSAAPIAAAEYLLCPSSNAANDSTGCQSGSRSGSNIDEIPNLEVPHPGSWKLSLYLVDAAGNAASSSAAALPSLRYDPDTPNAAFLPMTADDPTRVRVAASDATSGLSSESLEINLDGTSTWTEIPVTPDSSGFSAALDDGALAQGLYHLRARVVDAAGNDRTIDTFDGGQPAALALPVRLKTRLAVGHVRHVLAHIARSGKRTYRRVLVDKPRSSYGRTVRLNGRLTTPGANPLAAAPVEVWQQVEAPGAAWTQIATVQTSRTGRFSFKALKGPSRLVQFRYTGTATVRSRISTVEMRVKATTTMRANRHHVNNGDFVSFHGRLQGHPIPTGGKLVELQVFTRRQWRTFAQVRADESTGLWAYRYRFEAITGKVRFRFRARIRKRRRIRSTSGCRARSTSPCAGSDVVALQRVSKRVGSLPQSEGGAVPMPQRLRSKLTFANVTSVIALFVALGGTGYAAATLPHNSVGSAQLRTHSVGQSELKSSAVTSRAIKDHSVTTTDMSATAVAALKGNAGAQGPAGPAGPTYSAAVPSGGTVQRGNAISAQHAGGTNEYRVAFSRDVSSCVASATLAAVPAGTTVDQPQAGRITVAQDQATSVLVRTYAADGTAAEQPFNLVLAC